MAQLALYNCWGHQGMSRASPKLLRELLHGTNGWCELLKHRRSAFDSASCQLIQFIHWSWYSVVWNIPFPSLSGVLSLFPLSMVSYFGLYFTQSPRIKRKPYNYQVSCLFVYQSFQFGNYSEVGSF